MPLASRSASRDANNLPIQAGWSPNLGVVNFAAGTVTTDTNNTSSAPQLVEFATTNQVGRGSTTAIAAAAAASAIKATSGSLISVLVTTTGTAALLLYDNATTASGTIIGVIPANAAATGVPFVFNMPAANGIWCASGTNSPAITINWS